MTVAAQIAIAALLLWGPGALLARLIGVDRAVPAFARPAVWSVLSLALGAVLFVVRVGLHLPLSRWAWVSFALALGSGAGASVLAWRRRGGSRPPGVRQLPRRLLGGSSADRGWALATGGALAVLAAAGALAGSTIGPDDSLYHAAYALKLQLLDHVTFANTGMFADGDQHPGYVIGVAHELVATVAQLSGSHPLAVVQVLGALLVPLLATAYGFALWAFVRHPAAVLFGIVAFAASWPLSAGAGLAPLQVAWYPGTLSLHLAVPVALGTAMLVVGAAGRGWRWPLVLFAAAAADAVVLHISYALWICIALFGCGIAAVVGLGVRHERGRTVVRAAGLALLVVAFIGLYVLLAPVGDTHGHVDRSRLTTLAQLGGRRYELLFVGDPQAFHMRASATMLRGAGGLAAWLLAALLVLRYPRWRAAALFAGTGLVVAVLSQSSTLFPLFVDVVAPSQARRLPAAMPIALIVGASVVALTAWCGRRARRVAVAALGVGVATAALLAVVEHGGRAMAGASTLALLSAVVAFGAAALLAWRRSGRLAAPGGYPTTVTAPGVAVVLALAIVAGGWAHVRDGVDTLRAAHAARASGAMHVGQLGSIPEGARVLLDRLEPGDVVLADPVDSVLVQGLAPVYTVGYQEPNVARTTRNRLKMRRETMRAWFAASTTSDRRAEILRDEDVSLVLLRPATAVAAADVVSGYRRVDAGDGLVAWVREGSGE